MDAREPVIGKILIVDYDPRWPKLFEKEAVSICEALGPYALRIEHTGSTAVPGLAAKPTIDMTLLVHDSADEDRYVPPLEKAGYVLCIREPEWHEHRMFKRANPEVNLHVFSIGCPEVDRILLFRDHLRSNPEDRDLYQRTKLALALQPWAEVQEYADAKTEVIQQILNRAQRKSE